MAKSDNKPSKKKSKKNKNNGPKSVAMKNKSTKADNPFETIWSRRKFDILGKKRKGEEVRIGLSRSLAIQKRTNTLLKEYEQSGKSSVFVDKRIGERNDGLGEFDKAIMRSQRQRQLKLGKKSKYNLSDGEEDEFEMPGIDSLSGRDDFEDDMLSDDGDNDDEDESRSNVLKQLSSHHRQNSDEGDLMEGEKNAQKAKEKEENEQLMEELDKSFSSLVQSEVLLSLTEPSKMNALKALVNKGIPNEHVKRDDQNMETSKQEQPDSYDKLVKEMALDMRARPSDRTKTAEEIAQEERERLERLEEERQKRMLATDDTSDEDNEDEEKSSTQRPRSISGDDLGDSFTFDEEPKPKRGWVDEVLERKDTTESEDEDSSEDSGDADGVDVEPDEDNDENENTITLKDWEQSDNDDLGTDLEEDEEGERELDDDEDDSADGEKEIEPKGNKVLKEKVKIKEKDNKFFNAKKMKSDHTQPSTQPDIPFLIDAPKSLEEFCALVENCSNADKIVVINRIRASNAIKLAAENRKKMQVFYGVLLQYFAVSANKKPLNFELLNLLVMPLMEMSVEIPYFAAICARQRILRTRTQLCEDIKNPENGCWPSLKTLFLLKLWSMIFPCSDFRHVVMTPAILLMCEYLMRCPVMSGRDIAIGSFLCSMVLSVSRQSRKFCPEVIAFLRTLLVASTDSKPTSYQESEFHHLLEFKALRPLLCIRDCVNNINPLNFLVIMELPDDSSFFRSDNFRASLLMTVMETLRGFVDIYGGLNSFPEIFLPLARLLLDLAQQENMLAALQEKFKDAAEVIKKKVDEHHMVRQPLQMCKKKPVPIKLLNPKFEENFVKGRDYDPDRERAEARKLKKLIKREAKGAARELRKDNYFLSQVKEKEKAVLAEEKAEKFGKAKAFLQEQEHAFKSGQLGRGRKRRK
ncbi:nucleolar-like protein [Citrus sinensis]|nr:nucleolar-like protein [Citrus sinensis]